MTGKLGQRTIIRPARFAPAEWTMVKERAATAGKRPATFIREAALTAQVIQAPPRRISHADRAVLELARLGNNLNQLARAANASGRFAIEESLLDLVEQIHAIIRGMR